MRVLVAPLELKGTLTASQAAAAIAEGLRAAKPHIDLELMPLADGGPGTLAAIERSRRFTLVKTAEVTGADGSRVTASWLAYGDKAVIESAQAVGLTRFPGRAPMGYGSRGVGELIGAAMDHGARDIAVGIGGTGSVDMGLGCAAALGVRFFDTAGRLVEPVPANFAAIHAIDGSGLDARLREVRLTTWNDVQAPLLGGHGFVYRYGAQKGVSVADMPVIEREAARISSVGPTMAGDGAGGGLAWALRVLCGATSTSGFEAVAEALGLVEALERCSFAITAEGRLDAQSAQGKGTWALGQLARALERPVILMTGGTRLPRETWRTAFTDVVTVGDGPPTDTDDAYQRLVTTARAYSLHGPLLA